MAFEFLTDEHLARFGRYPPELTLDTLGEHFYLTPADRAYLSKFRRDHTRLGYAMQQCGLTFLGTFLVELNEAPDVALNAVAGQLGVAEPRESLLAYLKRYPTRFEHQRDIKKRLGYKDFDAVELLHLARFLYARLSLGNERPIELFDLCTRKLLDRHVVLPGASTLARLIVRVRERVTARSYERMARKLDETQKDDLEALLVVAPKQRFSPFEQLRSPPTIVSARGLLKALDRLAAVRKLGVHEIDLGDVPPGRLTALCRDGLTEWAHTVARMSPSRRLATLLATVQHLELKATDDVLDVFDNLMLDLGVKGEQKRRKDRLRSLRDLDGAALLLRDALRMFRNQDQPEEGMRARVEAHFGADTLTFAERRVTELASPVENVETQAWLTAVGTVGAFLPALLKSVTFEGTPAQKPLLDALDFLRGTRTWSRAPDAFVPKAWEAAVYPHGTAEIDRHVYLLCAAHRLHGALRGREVFVPRSLKYGDPRTKLLQGEAWEAVKPEVLRSLDLPEDGKMYVQTVGKELDELYREAEARLPENTFVRLENGVPIITPLEKIPETPSYLELEAQTSVRLPVIDASELVLEVNAFAPFVDAMVEAVDGSPRRGDLHVSVAAALIAEACNIGLKAIARSEIPALTLGRLSYVKQHYVHSDALLRANAVLVEAQSKLLLARVWGGGEVASADGLRFVAPVRNIVARPNKKYFGSKRGITWYSLTSDQYTGLHGIVVPGTLRDSLYLLSVVLEQQTSLQPKTIMTDTAGYSDVVFGLFKLLGLQFSPRIADMEGTRYWRIDREADYRALNEVAKHRVNVTRIAQQWPDLLKLAGSLKRGTVRAQDVMRILMSRKHDGGLSDLGKAVAELGKVAKTLHLLQYVDDEAYRRRTHAQLNRGENRGKLARKLCYGNKGEIRKKYWEGMENQLGALGLVVNAVALWNTRYLGSIIEWLRVLGEPTLDEDVVRLSPLRFEHVNVLGRFHFDLPEDLIEGAMRPLRDPESLDEFELAWKDEE